MIKIPLKGACGLKFLKRFFDGVQRDARLFLFVLILLEVYRGLFIVFMSSYMNEDSGAAQIFSAMFTGLRLSLKTAGAVTLISFVFVTIVGLRQRLRLVIGIAASFIFSLLFMLRFPYYRAFQSTFGLEVVQGFHDDIWSIIVTMFQEYGILWRFIVALILTLLCIAALSRLLIIKTFPLPELDGKKKYFFGAGLGVGIILFGLFVRFGGSFTYGSGINWENAGVTTDDFLNECILDDAQALYRARAMAKRMEAGEISGVDANKILESAQLIATNHELTEKNLAPYLERKAKGEHIQKPKHIFIILGETFMQWPMLGKYDELLIAEGIKSLIAEENCYYSRNFMPNGDFTSTAITGLVTGLPDVNIKVNYQARTYEKLYITAMAPAFKELGYKVDFWYGGMPSWDSIAKMSLAQGFDNFYGYPDFNAPKQTTWGTKDENLFNALLAHLPDEPPTVHLIMTTTNHPPYNLDLAAEGYDIDAVTEALKKIPSVDDVNQLAVELGHYWYMDEVITNFVRAASEKFPESIFVVTGDHAVRCDPSTHPTLFEHQSVPFVLYGAGVTKEILPPDAVGDHISIVPTLIELIAPKDFAYYSIAPSLFESDGVGFNNAVFLTSKVAGQIDSDVMELLPHVASNELNDVNLTDERAHALEIIGAMRTVAWWMIINGLFLGNDTNN
ncbi:MAG: sulfatase-like hydrolase/transferase [Selenomonadaceae bacterium]|nr:sulfatase-like hydrolase/transferase [Selenomonadaceae bacterium]